MKCQYCKRDFKNPKVQERFCEQNPNKAHPWPKEMMKSHDKEIQESQSSSSSFSKPLQQPPSTLAAHDTKPDQKPIIITDAQPYLIDDYQDGLVAWFDDGAGNRISKNQVLSGIVHNGIELILC